MKRIILILFILLPIISYAGVIVKRSGERLEGVSIKTASGNDVIYVTKQGTQVTLSKSEVSAILYDDGRYEEIPIVMEPDENPLEKITSENASNNMDAMESSSKSVTVHTREQQQNTKTPIPQKCMNEGNDVYKKTFEAERNKFVQLGYSKTQAYQMASNKAYLAKQEAIEKCCEEVNRLMSQME